MEILGLTPEALASHREAVLEALEMDKNLLTDF
jgi:hypothetical protein